MARSCMKVICVLAITLFIATFATAKIALFKPSELKFKDLIKKYGVKKVIQAHNLRHKSTTK